MKKALAVILTVILVLSVATISFASHSANRACRRFTDADNNGICDNRGIQKGNRANFVDENNDGVCDNKGENFVDEDNDGVCDNKGENFVDEDTDGVCDNKNNEIKCGRQYNKCGRRYGKYQGKN